MAAISTQVLQALSQEFSRIPTDQGDLANAATQLSAQLDGLARLDDLDLFAVEPATVLLAPPEALRGTR